jgi:hypothetical protein
MRGFQKSAERALKNELAAIIRSFGCANQKGQHRLKASVGWIAIRRMESIQIASRLIGNELPRLQQSVQYARGHWHPTIAGYGLAPFCSEPASVDC